MWHNYCTYNDVINEYLLYKNIWITNYSPVTGAANVLNDDILSLIYTDGPAAPDYVLHKLSYGVKLVVEDGAHVSRLAWTGRSYRKIIRNVAYICLYRYAYFIK